MKCLGCRFQQVSQCYLFGCCYKRTEEQVGGRLKLVGEDDFHSCTAEQILQSRTRLPTVDLSFLRWCHVLFGNASCYPNPPMLDMTTTMSCWFVNLSHLEDGLA